MSRDPHVLIGCHVVEVGLRQVWPFITFATPDGRETRLYIDTTFSVQPTDFTDVGDDDAQRLLALSDLPMQTVEAASVGVDGSLLLELNRLRVTISGTEAEFTAHACWWIGTDL